MRANSRLFLGAALTVWVTCIGCAGSKFLLVPNKRINSIGRVGVYREMAEIYWPGSGLTFTFDGSLAKAVLQDERGHNYFNVVVDDSLVNVIKVDTSKKTYLLTSGLVPGRHTVQLLKRADWFRGKTKIFGFGTDGAIKKSNHIQNRSIEFYGNSVTVGAAVEDFSRDNGDSIYTNNYNSYAAITARHYNARYSCIASSGIGLMVSWGSLIMPDIYDRINPDDSTSKWDFSIFQPDIVVLNLFQNDQAIINLPDYIQFKRRFGNKPPDNNSIILSYKKFVERIRQHYPHAYIICTLGPMDAVRTGSEWPGYIQTAVKTLNDKKVFTYFFAYKNSHKHPKVAEQQQMANALIEFIKTHIDW